MSHSHRLTITFWEENMEKENGGVLIFHLVNENS